MFKFICILLLLVSGANGIQSYEQKGPDTHGKESENYNKVTDDNDAYLTCFTSECTQDAWRMQVALRRGDMPAEAVQRQLFLVLNNKQ